MFKIKTDQASIADSTGGGNYLNKSGVYNVLINHASVSVSKNGAESIIFNVTTEDGQTTKALYGPSYQNNNGSTNEIGERLYIRLGVIAGMEAGESPAVEEETHMVGYPAKEQELQVITNFTDLPVRVQIKEEYGRYNGNITERINIVDFFRAEDGATAAEITKEADFGKKLAEVEEKYASNVTYRESVKGAGDAPTPEEVAEWKANKRSGSAAPKAATKPGAKKNPFGK